ncbi:MAG: TM0106 family RecB-like putative nuclease, partial [Vulcanimicrobiaceae bacterium]
MQVLDGRFIYSATDLNNYLECEHLVALERQVALAELTRLDRNPTVELIAEKGLAHERDYLERLRSEHEEVVEIAQAENSIDAIERAEAATAAAMERGAPVIYQGTFFDGTFLGKSDFLLRTNRPNKRWNWSYEVADTKLALHDKPYFIIQLCHYSEQLARVQGSVPEHMYVVLGNGERRRFRVDDFSAYYRHLKAAFLRTGAGGDAYPFKCAHCGICDWSPACERRRADDDHLSLVAGMRRDYLKPLETAGLATVASLAAEAGQRPTGMQAATFERLHRQAALQVRGRETGAYHYELLDHHPVQGFGLMPMPATGDVFFDMEGDQFYEIGVGLEYLFGCYAPDDQPPFVAFWGTDRAGEKRAFEQCVDFLTRRRRQYPTMHVYHYAPYEKTALRKLAQRHHTREDEVDELLKSEVLVDLYAVVRQSLMISQSSYSIKKLEPFYRMKRTADVRRGDDSIVMFETWLKDPSRNEILADIERYNEEDCVSTAMLRDWLLERRTESTAQRN